MKKLLLLIILFAVFLTSCGSVDYFGTELTDEVMKEHYPELYPMSEEECGHKYLYYHTIDGMDLDLSPDEYHIEYCIYPNCEHEKCITHHLDAWVNMRISLAVKYPDGHWYHAARFMCAGCGKEISLLLRCNQNFRECTEYSLVQTHSMEEWKQIGLGDTSLLRK